MPSKSPGNSLRNAKRPSRFSFSVRPSFPNLTPLMSAQARPSLASPPCSEVCRSHPVFPRAHPFPDFQLAFCPTYFHREIPIWKVIIQLNLVGSVSSSVLPLLSSFLHSSVKRLLSIIEDELETARPNFRRATPSPPLRAPPSDAPTAGHAFPRSSTSPPSRHVFSSSASASSRQGSFDVKHDSTDPPLTQAHSALRLRLLPLLSVETNLARQLLPEFGGESPPLPSSTGWTKWASGAGDHAFLSGNGEICVRAGGAWKSILERVTGTLRDTPEDLSTDSDIEHHSPPLSGKRTARTRPHPSDPTPLLEALAPDIHTLWSDPAVKALLKRKGVHMEHSAGFFLNDVLRIAKPGWKPGIGLSPDTASHLFSHASRRRHCTSKT